MQSTNRSQAFAVSTPTSIKTPTVAGSKIIGSFALWIFEIISRTPARDSGFISE